MTCFQLNFNLKIKNNKQLNKHYCWTGGSVGAKRVMIAMPEYSTFLPMAGTRGLFANTSTAKRNSWNILRLYGLRRDEYLNAKKW